MGTSEPSHYLSTKSCRLIKPFSQSQKFFALPQNDKEKALHPPVGWYQRGYSGVGREKVVQMIFDEGIADKRKVPDVKETFDFGSEDDNELPNIWIPDEVLPGFRAFFLKFFDACHTIEVLMLRTIAIGMGLKEDFFLNYHTEKTNQCRLLHYPAVEAELLRLGKAERVAAHSDFGTMTILFQDEVGGLEVEDIHEKGKYNPVPCIPGTAVVNIGDLLMRWSNDELRSTLHRVRAPPPIEADERSGGMIARPRYSIPYFISPDRDRVIDCLPECCAPDLPKKYEAITSRDYVNMRLNAIY